MLVKFQSSTSGEIMMFAESARTLLRVLNKECTARGVITLEQLPDELALLREAVSQDRRENPPDFDAPPRSGADLPVGFSQRATPFLEMMERTLRKKGFLLWEAPSDFGDA